MAAIRLSTHGAAVGFVVNTTDIDATEKSSVLGVRSELREDPAILSERVEQPVAKRTHTSDHSNACRADCCSTNAIEVSVPISEVSKPQESVDHR